jgi:hypothetical protein
MITFKNRGHFCNYCRKIIFNKLIAAGIATDVCINQVIWYAWDHPDERETILSEIIALDATHGRKAFQASEKVLLTKYGYESKATDTQRKRNYKGRSNIEHTQV